MSNFYLKCLPIKLYTDSNPPQCYVADGIDFIVTDYRELYDLGAILEGEDEEEDDEDSGYMVTEGYHPFRGIMDVTIKVSRADWSSLKEIEITEADADRLRRPRSNKGEL